MEIIPAIDIIKGKCVRLTEGDYALKTEYAVSPLEMAKMYESHGIKRLHLVDLDGARLGKVVNWDVASSIAQHTNLVVDFGGGVKTTEEIEQIIDMGIEYVVVGSMAVKQPAVFAGWVKRFGPDRFMLGADAKDDQVMVSGWQENSKLQLFYHYFLHLLFLYYSKGHLHHSFLTTHLLYLYHYLSYQIALRIVNYKHPHFES